MPPSPEASMIPSFDQSVEESLNCQELYDAFVAFKSSLPAELHISYEELLQLLADYWTGTIYVNSQDRLAKFQPAAPVIVEGSKGDTAPQPLAVRR